MTDHKRILLIEDEVNLAKGLKLNFELEGYEVLLASTGAEARKIHGPDFDLVLLDLMLPDASGFDLLQEIKRQDIRQPVMVLTACATDDDRITGLSLGADDYVTKPFRLPELMLRVRGMIQRGAWYRSSLPDMIRIGDAVFRPRTSVVERAGHTQLLTELELKLLLHLWRKRDTYVSREDMLVEVWGYSADAATRTVDIFVSRLRKMLGDDATAPRLLLTARGQGYMLSTEPRNPG